MKCPECGESFGHVEGCSQPTKRMLVNAIAAGRAVRIPANCGECLMEHVEIVALEADGSCKCCQSGHKKAARR